MQKQHEQRMAEVQRNYEQRMTQAERRDDEASERIARFERSYIAISEILLRHDDQIVSVTDGLNRLTVVVEQYVLARGNSNNGA